MKPIDLARDDIHGEVAGGVAEVSIRFLPDRGATGVGFSSEAQRDLNVTFGHDHANRAGDIWRAVVKAIQAVEVRLARHPEVAANTFRAEVLRIRLPPDVPPEEASRLLTDASRKAVESYIADLDEGRVRLSAGDAERPFEYRPSLGFDEEFISRRPCFLEYVAETRPGALFGFAVSLSTSIEKSREDRTLTPCGANLFRSAVSAYLCGCRPEADALVARSHEMLTLADQTDEKAAGDYGSGWGLGQRYAALAYVHWLRTGEAHEEALAKANSHLLSYYRRSKNFDRRTANLEAPSLLFLGADSVLLAMRDRLSAHPGRGASTPGGLFGDALRVVTAADDAGRDRVKSRLRKRLPLHFFRSMHRGHASDVAFLLHALFPRPDGPPSRLIERVWDILPEIERRPEAHFGWDVARE